jgi:hypothetical protein
MDYTIIGGEVNLAARLEKSCDPDGILISQENYALVKDLVSVDEREPLIVKGIRREIRTYAITNIYEDIESEKRFIRSEKDGMLVFLDLNKLTGEEKERALSELEKIRQQLKEKDEENL